MRDNFSDGERQRIAIARAILKDSNIVIFHEGTSAIDIENEALIYNYISDLIKKGKTVIIISHRPAVLNLHIRQLKLMKEG